MALYTLAPIDNSEDAKIFFETYNIPYQVIVRGENKPACRGRCCACRQKKNGACRVRSAV